VGDQEYLQRARAGSVGSSRILSQENRGTSMKPELTWPARWQPEAIEAIAPYVDTDYLVEVLVGAPATSIDGSSLAGYLFTAGSGQVQIIHDRSGRPDVYPWSLLAGPVLRVTARLPSKRRSVVYMHPDWNPRQGEQ